MSLSLRLLKQTLGCRSCSFDRLPSPLMMRRYSYSGMHHSLSMTVFVLASVSEEDVCYHADQVADTLKHSLGKKRDLTPVSMNKK